MISGNRHPGLMSAVAAVAALTLLLAACGATPTATPTLAPPTPTVAAAAPTATTMPAATKPPAAPTATSAAAAPTATSAPAAPTPTTPPTPTQPPAAPTATTAAAAPSVSFAKDVLPVFQKNCTRCHGGSSPRSGMSLESYQGAMKGGLSAPDVVPGDPEHSLLYTYPRDGVMPLGGAPLSAADVQKIGDWIKAGAPNN